MKKIFFLAFILCSFVAVKAQMQDPVKWVFSSKKISADTYEVYLKATMEKGWHVYSQNTPKGGPVPTSIQFTSNPLVTTVGAAKEIGKLEQKFEKLFKVNVKQYSNSFTMVQTVKVKGGVKTSLKGTVKFMTCNDKSCLPPKDVPFTVSLQ